jgi:hypothetical protein
MEADRLDPPEVRVVGVAVVEVAQQSAAPGETVNVALSPPEEPTIDLTEEDGDHRSRAVLDLMDESLCGWLLVTLREHGDGVGAFSVQGFVPTFAYDAYVECLDRVEAALDR